MSTFILTFMIIGLAVLAMAVGVLAGRKPIGGSCGGLNKFGMECIAGCEKSCDKHEEDQAKQDVKH